MDNRNLAGARTQAATYDEGLRQYMLSIYNYMSAALALTALVAYVGASVPAIMNLMYVVQDGIARPSLFGWLVVLAPVGMVIYLGVRINNMSMSQAQGAFWVFAAVMGLSLSHIFLLYTGVSIAKTLLITSGSFAGLSLYGYTTKKDLTGMGSFLIMGAWGILLAMVVNIWLKSSGLDLAISLLGVFIFAGLTAYDTQKLRRSYYELGGDVEHAGKVAIMGALNLYLDFINMFLFLLRFFGDRR